MFLLRELNEEHKLWDVLVEPARKIRIGNKLYFVIYQGFSHACSAKRGEMGAGSECESDVAGQRSYIGAATSPGPWSKRP